jgi:hypothetical protein
VRIQSEEIVERACDAQSVQNYMHGFKILSSTLGCVRTRHPGLRPDLVWGADFLVRKVKAARRQRRGW